MTKRANSKYKLDRRVGENLWGRPKSPVNKRSYGPGQHGQRRAKKLSDYGTQLQAKQKLKEIDEQLFRLRFQMSMGQMDGLKKVRQMKKDRARMLTIQRQRTLAGEKK